jgi:hypothetical protein
MNRNNLYLRLSGFVILLAITACALPGQTAPTAPTVDPSILATHVAGTAQAAVQLTQQASIPTPIPATSTPRISPITGTSLVKLEDQSTLFTDPKVGIQLTVPTGWMAIRVNEEEYYAAFALDTVLQSPAINDRLAKIQSNNTDYFRLEAIDIRPEHVVNGMISDMAVILQPENSKSLEEWASFERSRKSPFEGYKFHSSQFQKTTDGTRILVVEESWKFNTEGRVFLRRVFFNLPSGTITLDFQTYFDFKDTVLPDFEQFVNSLKLLNP